MLLQAHKCICKHSSITGNDNRTFLSTCRGIVQAGEHLLVSKVENKVLNGSASNLKEGRNASTPEFIRSRSTPRGKFFGLS